MAQVYINAQLVGIFISFICIVILLLKTSDKEQKFMITSFICTMIYCCGVYLEYTATVLPVAVVAVKIQYFSACYLPLFIVIFSFHHCRVTLPKAVIFTLTAMETIVLVLVWNCERNKAFYASYELVRKNGYSYFSVTHGPCWFLYIISYIFILILIFGVTFYRITRTPKGLRANYYVICFSTILPALTYVLYKANYTNHFDPNSIVYLIVCLLLYFYIYRLQFFGLIEQAKEKVVDNMKEAFIVVDNDLNLLDCNLAAKKLFPELRKMKNVGNISNIPVLKEIFSNDTFSEFELNGHYYKKHITHLDRVDSTVNGSCAIVIDVTQTHQYVNELISANEAAMAANETKSRYLANVSHEIRTPMNAIVGFSELILHQNPPEQVYEYAKDINLAAHSLLSVINDILDLSKIEAGKLKLHIANYTTMELLENVISIIKLHATNKKLDFKIDINPNLPRELIGDIVHLRQILINILANAVKYTDKGWISLEITFAVVPELGDTINLVIRIKDTGVGISSENIPNLFDEFTRIETAKEIKEGSGLGLAICKNLVTMMEGTIDVESTVGMGSTFTVTVPQKVVSMDAIDAEALSILSSVKDDNISLEQNAKNSDISQSFWAPNVSVLVVDDSNVNLKLVTSILEEYQIKADTTNSGRNAVDMVGNKDYHIVFMDHMMPDFDGIMATKAIRTNGHDELPIVALTANAVIGVKEMFLANGFTDFLPKPVNIVELENILLRYLPKELINYYEKEKDEFKANKEQLAMMGLDIPGKSINVVDGYNNCMKNKDTYISVLDTFYRTCISLKEDVLVNIKEKNYDKSLLFTHTLKNAAFTIGANRLSQLSKEAESILKNKNYALFELKVGKLMELYEEVIIDLTEFYTNMKHKDLSSSYSKPPIAHKKFINKLTQLKNQLEMMDSVQAIDTITYLTSHSYKDKTITVTLSACKNDIADFDYDRALEKINSILNRINVSN
ncbi:MAG: response regulator [Lachnospiraceae bacterium]|nr:response regulator [Lachnospiraceae bacterium]